MKVPSGMGCSCQPAMHWPTWAGTAPFVRCGAQGLSGHAEGVAEGRRGQLRGDEEGREDHATDGEPVAGEAHSASSQSRSMPR